MPSRSTQTVFRSRPTETFSYIILVSFSLPSAYSEEEEQEDENEEAVDM